METSNQASVQNLNSVWNIAGFRCQAGVRITGLLICIICRNLSNNGHFTLATLPFCNLTSILKLETIYIFEFQRLYREMNLKGKANHIMLVSNLGRLCILEHLSISHASLALEVSNNPIKIRVLNSGLI